MTRRSFNWRQAGKRLRVVQQNIERKYQRPILGPQVRVRSAIPELKLPPLPPRGEKK